MGPRPTKSNKTEHEGKRTENVTIYMIPSSREKEKMQLFYIPNGGDVWLPKSQVTIGAAKSVKEAHILACELPLWLAQDKDIEDHVE